MQPSTPLSVESPLRRKPVQSTMEKSIQELVEESLKNGDGDNTQQLLSTMPNPPMTYEDPCLNVRDALWFHTGVNDLVRIALYKMDKAFAYNSVFFLNTVMSTQMHYLALDFSIPSTVKLEISYVERIAEILAVRLARRGKDNSSPSRELQLRTLVSALSLLSRQGCKLKSDMYAKLLDRLSERDYENYLRYMNEGVSPVLGSGDCEFLVRYACDLVRRIPNDYELRKIETFGSQAVHFMIAEGLVDQSGGELDLENMNCIYKRLTAPLSDWHEDLYHLSESVSDVINLEYQSKLTRNDMLPTAEPRLLPGNIPQIIIERVQRELGNMNLIGVYEGSVNVHETCLFVTALLDLLVQLVVAFPACEEAIESSEQLALSIITTSNDREVRLKALELIIASTTGCDEDEFFDAMRDLESYILKSAGTTEGTDVEVLRFEKRAAMDRYDKKVMLYTGAMESLHRRLQDRFRGGRIVTDRSLTISPSWESERLADSPAPTGTIFSGSVTNSPVSQFAPALKVNPFPYVNDMQACAPLNSHPPESLNGDQQRLSLHETEPVIPENYDRSGTSLSDYPQQNENEHLIFRPLSFQRDAIEVLQVPRKKLQQQASLLPPTEEEEDIVASSFTVESQPVADMHPSGIYRGEDEKSVMEVLLTTDLEEFRPPRKNRQKGIIQKITQTEHSQQKMSNDDIGDERAGKLPSSGVSNTFRGGNSQETCTQNSNMRTLDSPKKESVLESFKPQPSEACDTQISPPQLPQIYEDKILVESPTEIVQVEFVTQETDNEHLNSSGKNSVTSLELPIQGVNDEDFCLPKTISERDDRRSSTLSPIPVASEFPDIAKPDTGLTNAIIRDGSDAPEVVEFIPEEIYYSTVVKNSEANIPKKRGSRASRLFSALPGSSVKSGRLSRFGSLRFSTSSHQSTRAPTPARFYAITDDGNCNPLALRKSQTGPEVLNEKMEILRRHANITYKSAPGNDSSPNLSKEPLLSPSVSQVMGGLVVSDYESITTEHVYKLCPKENTMVFLSLDCRHVVYMSPDGFQVFTVPTPHDPVIAKARYIYRLGEAEGLKKGKVPWEYKAGAASRRYIATITKERLQVHDLQQACASIYTKKTQDHIYHSVAIAADKLAVGMSPITGEIGEGVITIFKMRSATLNAAQGQKWDEWKIIRLTVPSLRLNNDDGAPYFLSLTRDGKGLTACTNSGHFFAWDITGRNEPVLISSGQIIPRTDLIGAQVLTTSLLFPDMKHILCSTMSINDTDPGWIGCFAEPTRTTSQLRTHHPIRQVGLKIHHSAISPNGNATAFLSRTGRISVVPILHVEGDPNVTSTAAISAEHRLQATLTPETAGRVMFTPEGDKLICVDRKGKVVVLDFTKF